MKTAIFMHQGADIQVVPRTAAIGFSPQGIPELCAGWGVNVRLLTPARARFCRGRFLVEAGARRLESRPSGFLWLEGGGHRRPCCGWLTAWKEAGFTIAIAH
ncbi:hypothetical protein COCON_G00018690 [Conger conger]|uniref:Uncharacterized protein n=1 Tax=Conger conger TaxID=82655 RepID=A0A9Q1E3X7_CONCO|nr:hypothetical protein COCON_G00018690 [Conger conger]